MAADLTSQAADVFAATPQDAIPQSAKERNFRAAIACAFLLHSALLIGAIRMPTRQLGEADGLDKAISIEIVTEKDLQSKTTVPVDPPAAPPVPPPQLKGSTAAEPATPQPPQPPQEEQQETPKEAAKSEPAQDAAKALESEPDILSLEGPKKPDPAKDAKAAKAAKAESKSEPKTTPKEPKEKRVASRDPGKPLDTRIPQSSLTGRSASFVRPPGITRSGLNDQFARNVIRALQQTMPQLTDTFGRSTIRILLDENGNIANVEIVNPGKDPKIAQSVAFAARQTNYPIPPGGSNLADRTFVITYIYE